MHHIALDRISDFHRHRRWTTEALPSLLDFSGGLFVNGCVTGWVVSRYTNRRPRRNCWMRDWMSRVSIHRSSATFHLHLSLRDWCESCLDTPIVDHVAIAGWMRDWMSWVSIRKSYQTIRIIPIVPSNMGVWITTGIWMTILIQWMPGLPCMKVGVGFLLIGANHTKQWHFS